MSRYMDPAIADQLLRNDQNILGGQSQEATILFSDIRGFTSITEALGAAGTVSLLNEYFTLMVEIIQQENGMLDKFIGDAIMAGFGIPIAHGDDEDRALRAAIAMIRSLWQWNIRRAGNGMPGLDMGIGLNTDIVVCGNIGSPKRMDFTMIGDGVNLASRLESACKQYAAHILISENTHHKLKGVYRTREADLVVVKGKSAPVAIFEVLDYHSEQSFPNLMEALGYFKEGLASYRRQDWGKARKSFTEALRNNPADRLPALYLERTAHLERNPPGDDWAGVWVMESK
jgi:adenylate cyclase